MRSFEIQVTRKLSQLACQYYNDNIIRINSRKNMIRKFFWNEINFAQGGNKKAAIAGFRESIFIPF